MNGNHRQEFERIFPNPDGVQYCRYQGWQVGRGIAQKNRALEPESA
ncbi:hypothetical protein ACJJIE_00050 (plasmid) [Microbulbifer sp. TRSA001]